MFVLRVPGELPGSLMRILFLHVCLYLGYLESFQAASYLHSHPPRVSAPTLVLRALQLILGLYIYINPWLQL